MLYDECEVEFLGAPRATDAKVRDKHWYGRAGFCDTGVIDGQAEVQGWPARRGDGKSYANKTPALIKLCAAAEWGGLKVKILGG